jgi:hypothetical protein
MNQLDQAFAAARTGRWVLYIARDTVELRDMEKKVEGCEGLCRLHRRGGTVAIFKDGAGFVRVLTVRQVKMGAVRGQTYDGIYGAIADEIRNEVAPCLLGARRPVMGGA